MFKHYATRLEDGFNITHPEKEIYVSYEPEIINIDDVDMEKTLSEIDNHFIKHSELYRKNYYQILKNNLLIEED